MKYIVQNGQKAQRKIEVAVNLDKQRYEIWMGNAKVSKNRSIEYVTYKLEIMKKWLQEHGLPLPDLINSPRGAIEQYLAYIDATESIEAYCHIFEIECHILLCEKLIRHEGMIVGLTRRNGKMIIGRIFRQGIYIKYHKLIKDGDRSGTFCKPYDIIGVSKICSS